MKTNSVALARGVLARQTGAAMILLDTGSGQYFELNETAACGLQALLDGADAGAAAERLAQQFSVSAQDARSDLGDLLAQLRQQGLLAE